MWDGIYLPSIKQSINLAHKQIIEYARLAEWDEVAIAEDDVRFTNHKSWEYFLSKKPNEFDIYLGGVFLGIPDDNQQVKNFTGMTCYIVSKRFYDIFLSVPDDEHIDRALDGLGKYIVCDPFICTQWDGISGNTGKYEEYGHIQGGRKFL